MKSLKKRKYLFKNPFLKKFENDFKLDSRTRKEGKIKGEVT